MACVLDIYSNRISGGHCAGSAGLYIDLVVWLLFSKDRLRPWRIVIIKSCFTVDGLRCGQIVRFCCRQSAPCCASRFEFNDIGTADAQLAACAYRLLQQ